MAAFMDDRYLLTTDTAFRLYNTYAVSQPIIDYHSHLPQGEILSRKRFSSMTELWLGSDHYKWRLMRAAGIPEDLVTGRRPDKEKFEAFCTILPLAAGNPIYHFSHLELKRIFGMDIVINSKNADRIWEEGNAKLAQMDTWFLLDQARVEIACTTDDPADDLKQHAELAKTDLKTKVYPAFRPDKAMRINADTFPAYLEQLGEAANIRISSFATLMEALVKRVDFFHSQGARVSDHSIEIRLPEREVSASEAENVFKKRLAGSHLSCEEQAIYHQAMLVELGEAYHKYGWTMCFHIGALRNANSRMMALLGPDSGYDSVSDMSCVQGIALLLDLLERKNKLTKTMLFCLDGTQNSKYITLAASYQDGEIPGKIQYGPGWWFNDTKEGNLQQLRDLSSNGLLGTFVGMLTDSRSFASYPRHDYFRRLLCRLVGEWVEAGEYPDDPEALETLISGIAYKNARSYFKMNAE